MKFQVKRILFAVSAGLVQSGFLTLAAYLDKEPNSFIVLTSLGQFIGGFITVYFLSSKYVFSEIAEYKRRKEEREKRGKE